MMSCSPELIPLRGNRHVYWSSVVIIEKHEYSVAHGVGIKDKFKYSSYCVSNLRGGIGKSTLSFNLAYMLSRYRTTLVADLCPQKNLTEVIMREAEYNVNIGDALRPLVSGPAFGDIPTDISYLISKLNDSFKGAKASYFIPGDSGLFAFPSSLYQQLQQAMAATNQAAVKNILLSLRTILANEMKLKGCDVVLTDCSPFYAGATHLGWCAADALIVPVRVDEHSVESLGWLLIFVTHRKKRFSALKSAGRKNLAMLKIAAIVMTMAGAKSQKEATPRRGLANVHRTGAGDRERNILNCSIATSCRCIRYH